MSITNGRSRRGKASTGFVQVVWISLSKGWFLWSSGDGKFFGCLFQRNVVTGAGISVLWGTRWRYRLHIPIKCISLATILECCSWLKILTCALSMIGAPGLMICTRIVILSVRKQRFFKLRKHLLCVKWKEPYPSSSTELWKIWRIPSRLSNMWGTFACWIH